MEKKKQGQSLYKAYEIFLPFIIYYVVYNIAFVLIVYACSAAAEFFDGGLREYLMVHAGTLTELVGGLSMLIAVLPLLPMLRQELLLYNKESVQLEKSGLREKALTVLLILILAVSSSVGLNILLSLTGLVQASKAYQDVASQQYSVVFGAGAVLFGLISPIAEEIVFRGLVFNRMRRYFSTIAAIIASGVLFGVYHGNLVQGIYGGCMGILLAYLYERMRSFLMPCLFHAAANFTVFSLAQNAQVHARLFTLPGCIVLLTISAACIIIIEKK